MVLQPPTVGQALSGVFGSISLTAWICLLLPQLIANYKAKSADGLSMGFLFIWLLGDITNLMGALWTDLAPTAVALACYFCFADMILIAQCTYYNTLNARRRARGRSAHSRRRRESDSSTLADPDAEVIMTPKMNRSLRDNAAHLRASPAHTGTTANVARAADWIH